MTDDRRPDPDALLAEIQPARNAGNEGRLKIFLGMCPGVGKTFAMLLAGQAQQEEGVAVCIGVVETHGRVETTAVAAGLLRIPRKKLEHRGITLEELDLDVILSRKPDLVLVDELAHSNAPGSRHPKRWQDVVEILKAGIDVYTTLNVQHIESYRDVVRQITGAPVNETVSDAMLDRADEIELIDITAEQLRKRLEEGKVYLGERAVTASENFFREGNLKALREIALRVMSEKADQDVRRFRSSRRITAPWRSRERLLVAVGSSPFSERLIRLTRRSAAAVHAPWIAVYVDTGQQLNAADRVRLESNLNLARSLGAEVVMTSGSDIVEALLRVSREQNVSQIVVGKPIVHPFVEWLSGGSLTSRLIRRSGDIDIYVVRADKSVSKWKPRFEAFSKPAVWREIGIGVSIVTITTLLGLALLPFIGYSAVGLLYLVSVLFGATFLSQWPILIAATLTALAWNFLFIPPAFTFYIRSAHDLILFVLYFVVALVLGQLHARLRLRERTERSREQQAVAFSKFSNVLTATSDFTSTLNEAAVQMKDLFAADISILLRDENDKLSIAAGVTISERELGVATWVLTKGEAAGRFTDTLPESAGFHIPLRASNRVIGVLSIFVSSNTSLHLAERQMAETLAAQLALVIERYRLQAEAERSRIEEKSRHLQKTLLNSVSHEFKTPLAVVSAAVDRLDRAENEKPLLIQEIRTAIGRLERILGNLLDIARIETGTVRPRLEWCDLHEIVHAAVERVLAECGPRRIQEILPDDAVEVDPGLLEEVLVNLVRNAAQYSPPDSLIGIRARFEDHRLVIAIEDEGPGIDSSETSRLFEKFARGSNASAGGLGLGLSIVRGLVEALGGSVSVRARMDGKMGSEFLVSLPIVSKPVPELERENEPNPPH